MQKLKIQKKGLNWLRDIDEVCKICQHKPLLYPLRRRIDYKDSRVVICYCGYCDGQYYLTQGLIKNKVTLISPGNLWVKESSRTCPCCKKKLCVVQGAFLGDRDGKLVDNVYDVGPENAKTKVARVHCKKCLCDWEVVENL